jgi:glycerol-3-phosphate acyltransferase PlsX
MRIALDAMGGDYAPTNTVKGAVKAVQEYKDISIILVGDEKQLATELEKNGYNGDLISLKHASEVVGMSEKAATAIRQKKDSSIRVAAELVRSGEADGVVSAGNSGMTMAISQLIIGKLNGVDRVAIGAPMPTLKGPSTLIDAGANVDCKPLHLFQFAVMGEAYYKVIFNVKDPTIGLLGIGEEAEKGNALTKGSFKLLERLGSKFIGNVEGKELFKGEANVVVCDGFVGNIALKIAEGLAEAMAHMMKEEISKSAFYKAGYLLIKPAINNYKKKTDYAEYGGAPLLGLNQVSIISHGRSSPKAIKNAVKVANELASKGVCQMIAPEISKTIDIGDNSFDKM